MKIELFPSLGPHCASRPWRSRTAAAAVKAGTTTHPGGNDRGLQEAPERKQPTTFWQKLKHSFDYGNCGDNG